MVSSRTIAGVLAFCLGLALLLVPGAGESIALRVSFVQALGLVLVGAGFVQTLTATLAERSFAVLSVPETRADLPTPGAWFGEQVAVLSSEPERPAERKEWSETRDALRERLVSVAVTTVQEQYGFEESEARRIVESGRWTDDPHATAYFTGEYPESPPLRERLRTGTPFGGPAVGRQAQHVATALGALVTDEADRPSRNELLAAIGERPDPPSADESGRVDETHTDEEFEVEQS